MWLEQGGETFFPLPRHGANQNNHQRVGECTAASLFYLLRCEVLGDACVGLDASSDTWPKLFSFFFFFHQTCAEERGDAVKKKYIYMYIAVLRYTKMLLSLQIHAKLANQWLVVGDFGRLFMRELIRPPKIQVLDEFMEKGP